MKNSSQMRLAALITPSATFSFVPAAFTVQPRDAVAPPSFADSALASHAQTGVSPGSIVVSSDGTTAVATNLERCCMVYDDPHWIGFPTDHVSAAKSAEHQSETAKRERHRIHRKQPVTAAFDESRIALAVLNLVQYGDSQTGGSADY
jgi:hypothetical protein